MRMKGEFYHGENFAVIRHVALNLLKKISSLFNNYLLFFTKISVIIIKKYIKRVAVNESYA